MLAVNGGWGERSNWFPEIYRSPDFPFCTPPCPMDPRGREGWPVLNNKFPANNKSATRLTGLQASVEREEDRGVGIVFIAPAGNDADERLLLGERCFRFGLMKLDQRPRIRVSRFILPIDSFFFFFFFFYFFFIFFFFFFLSIYLFLTFLFS